MTSRSLPFLKYPVHKSRISTSIFRFLHCPRPEQAVERCEVLDSLPLRDELL